jgi:polyphenol oxidase
MKYIKTALSEIPWVRHGFFTRVGGVSRGIYAGANCGWGSNDDIAHVRANRGKVAAELGIPGDSLVTLNQYHSAVAVTVDAPWTREDMPRGDALVTARPGIGIGALAADCAPILLASKKDRIVAAVHAGWKGAVGGVLEAAIAEMAAHGAKVSGLAAAVGPCIGPESYEVSEGFDAPFLLQDAGNARFFRAAAKKGHLFFDLPGYVAHRLKAAGVETVYETRTDTLPDEETFFSYRRACLRGEKDYGRQISAIAIV